MPEHPYDARMSEHNLTDRQRGILECIEACMEDRGFPPSVREIGDAVGLCERDDIHDRSTLRRDNSIPEERNTRRR